MGLITSGRYGRLWKWSLFKGSVTTYSVRDKIAILEFLSKNIVLQSTIVCLS